MLEEKVNLASPAWLRLAETILTELVTTYGKPEDKFSVCEVFLNVPADVNPESTVAWHFYISGSSVEVGCGETEDVEMRLAAEYEEALSVARLVYSPEDVAGSQQDGAPQPPEYLVELHNRLAVRTL